MGHSELIEEAERAISTSDILSNLASPRLYGIVLSGNRLACQNESLTYAKGIHTIKGIVNISSKYIAQI